MRACMHTYRFLHYSRGLPVWRSFRGGGFLPVQALLWSHTVDYLLCFYFCVRSSVCMSDHADVHQCDGILSHTPFVSYLVSCHLPQRFYFRPF